MGFPRKEFYYSRSQNQKKFLNPDKKENPNTFISKKYYQRIFRKYFPNLSFHCPRTDTCMICDKYAIEKRTSSSSNIDIKHESHFWQA